MKNLPYFIIIYLFCICCSKSDINSKKYFDIPHQNQENSINPTVKLTIVPVLIDSTIECSYVGNFWIHNDTLCFSDLYFNYIYRIRNDGSVIDKQVGKGNGPNEVIAFDYNIPLNNGYLLVSSANSRIYKFSSNGKKLSSVKINWKVTRAEGLKIQKNPDPRDHKAYEFDFGIDNIVQLWDNDHIAIGLTSSLEKFNGYFNTSLYYSFGRILAIINTENGEIENIIGRRSPVYIDQTNIPNFDHFCFDVKGDEIYLSFWPDHTIYVIDKQHDKALYSFGEPGRNMKTSYPRTNSYEEAEMQRVTDQQSFGHYHNIVYDKNSQLLFRSYTKGENATTDGLQVYKNNSLLADLDVQVGFKIVGSVEGVIFAQINDGNNENQKLFIYKVTIEGI
jgi:hypothetical protein